MNSIFNNSYFNSGNINNDSSLMNSYPNNELNLFSHEDSESNNNFLLDSNQNLALDINDIEENGAAPLIYSNNNNEHSNDFGNFSFLNDSNIQGVKIDTNPFCFNIIDTEKIEPNNIEEKDKEKDKEKEKQNEINKYNNFQRGDFVTPFEDNDDNSDNSNNNLNSKVINSSNSSIKVNTLETPLNNKSNKDNLENSSSSQSTNKSSSLNSSQATNQLNNVSNETLSPQKLTEEKTTNTPKKRKRRKTRSKTKSQSLTPNKFKFKLEGIRKKIKSRLFKQLKIYYNNKLLNSNSKMVFDYFPQSFITDVSIINNKSYLNLTMRNLLTKIFGTRAKDKEKLSINKKVLSYLDENPDIRIKSGIDNFLNSYYKDVIKEYVDGELFKDDIIKLKDEEESEEYIRKYIELAKNFVEFYESNGLMKSKTKS